MKTYRMNALMAGILYLLGTAFGIATVVGGEVLASSITNEPLSKKLLELVANNSFQISIAAFFILMMTPSSIANLL